MSFTNNERPKWNNTSRKLLQMDSLKQTLIARKTIKLLLTVIPNYLDELDKLDDVVIDDDVDRELEVVGKLK